MEHLDLFFKFSITMICMAVLLGLYGFWEIDNLPHKRYRVYLAYAFVIIYVVGLLIFTWVLF